jgi:hypothetical protein
MSDQPPRERLVRAEYEREPYVRATLDDGTTLDGKATAWTSTHVDVNRYDPDTPYAVVAGTEIHMHSAWVPADRVQRIKRSESA